jgi:hypothetical protein
MPRKPRGNGREKNVFANSETQELENLAAENLETGKEHDGPVEAEALPATEKPQPDDPAIEPQSDIEVPNVRQQIRRKMLTDLTED